LAVCESGKKSIIRLWNLSKPTASAVELQIGGDIRHTGFLSDRHLIAVSTSGTLTIADPRIPNDVDVREKVLEGLVDVVFLPDQRLLLAAPNQLDVWGIASNELKQLTRTKIKSGRTLSLVAVSPDGKQIATTHSDRQSGFTVNVYKASGTFVGKRIGGTGQLYSLVWSPCGRFLVGENVLRLIVWDADTGEQLAELEANTTSLFRSPCFHPSGRFLAAGGANLEGGVFCWDTETWQEIIGYHWPVGPVMRLTFHSDGTLAAAGGERGQVTVWDVDG
jgi:WD40 repeat protein